MPGRASRVRGSVPPGGTGASPAVPLAEAVAALRRRFGAAVLRRGDDPLPGSSWSTGVPVLDGRLTSGGLPRGRFTVLSAARPGVSGRLTLLQALAAVASRSMQIAYVDLAGTLDPGFLADLGADLDACLVVRPPAASPGTGLAMARALVRAGVPWLAVALGERRAVGGGPAAWEHALAALTGTVEGARAVTCVSAPAPLAAPLAYASSLTLRCTSLGWQLAHGDVIGLRVRLETVKSKVGVPGGEAALLLRYPRPHAAGEVVGMPAVVEIPAAPDGPPAPPVEAAQPVAATVRVIAATGR